MKLIKPSYEILTPLSGEQILKDIELAARTCYKSEDKIGSMVKCNSCKGTGKILVKMNNPETETHIECQRCKGAGELVSWEDLVQKLIDRGHEAMIEFGPSITVKFVCDRGVSHEFVRHRLASFAQESTRYCDYENGHVAYIIPPWLSELPEDEYVSLERLKPLLPDMKDGAFDWLQSLMQDEEKYKTLRDKGWSPQEARSVLPNALKTEINIKGNIREWRHIFKMRVPNSAHPQAYELMRPLLDEFKEKIPILFDDITY
jgi:thymidylate synthase (FAD)